MSSHLRIEDASVLLDDADGFIEGRDGIVSTIGVTQDGGQVQSQLLRVELGRKVVGKTVLLASRNLDIVP
jgi:hypothetical protein